MAEVPGETMIVKDVAVKSEPAGGLGTFERYLSLWGGIVHGCGNHSRQVGASRCGELAPDRIWNGQPDQCSDCRSHLANDHADDDEGGFCRGR
jgi:hypothetical protein